jgi:polyhydroxyalkanoate synthesis regulator protein
MLPVPFLRQLIRFYGDSIGKMVPSYLQVSLDTLTREQARVREQFASAFTPAGALEVYQEQARKNLAMFEQAMAVFSPFAHGPFTKGATDASDAPAASPGVAAAAAALAAAVSPIKPAAETPAKHEPAKPQAVKPDDGELARMRSQLASMQATIDKLAKDRG